MKKLLLVALAAGTFAFTSCSSDDDNGPSCEQLGQNYAEAMQAYSEDQSAENCAAWDEAADAYFNCAPEGQAVQYCPTGE